jgi:uncharacterized RDD family membrane protein YckC
MKVEYEKRFIAYLIDMLLSSVLCVVLIFFVPAIRERINFEFFFVLIYGISGIYFIVCYTLFFGISLGGLFLNVRIVSNQGRTMKFSQGFVRALLLSLFVLVIFNVIYMLIKKTQVAFFDDATNTKAVLIKDYERRNY